MSEYTFVEKPFLQQLKALGWQVIDQGEGGIPSDPADSMRWDFRQLILPEVFRQSVAAINTLPDGTPWLTQHQLAGLYDELASLRGSLIEASQTFQEMLYKHTVDRNEVTGEEYPTVKLVDFERPERNHFLAINQFRIDTPRRVKEFIIPDIVLFVNGIPLVVVECKEANLFTANPMYEAYVQLQRYSDQREETRWAGLSEGEPGLFHFNQLNITTSGSKAKYGSITASEAYFFPWRDVYPARYWNYTPPLGSEREQEVLIQGLLPPETLLDVVRSFVLFMDVEGRRVKIVPRYPQYRAACKLIDRLRDGESPAERSGVIWHTQGSGKSLTMVFAVRKLRRCEDLKDHKVILVNDRRELEKQLKKTAALTDEVPKVIEHSSDLTKLGTPAGNLNLVMVHKFQEYREDDTPDYLAEVLDSVPRHDLFGVINPSERVLMMIDEAHRTQGGLLSQNLFDAFPNAARIAYTGTPLVAEKYADRGLLTRKRFGGYIDIYTLHDSVEDGATVKILYEGKAVDVDLVDREGFEGRFADLCRPLSEKQTAALKSRYGTMGNILEAEQRIEEISGDLVGHYIDHILPDGFKAQVVASSQLAAVRYQRCIEKAIARRLEAERAKADPDLELIAKITFLKARTVVSGQGTNELAEITVARKQAREDQAVENFKKRFDYNDPTKRLTGIAFLVVCDMLLTGFDAPVEQVMYVDKKVRDHNLLQAIARVNRTASGKDCGYIVDYIGLTNHLQDAFSMYDEESRQEVQSSLESIDTEMPLLEQRYRRLINLFSENGVAAIDEFVHQYMADVLKEFEVLQDAIGLLEDVRLRADFGVYYKKFLQSLNIILPDRRADRYRVPARRFGYILAQVRQRYKDSSMSLAGSGQKVRNLINEYLVSEGIDPAIPLIEITDPNFTEHIAAYTGIKAKASEMEHAVRKHLRITLKEDPVFYGRLSEKLQALIEAYEENWEQLALELEKVRQEIKVGRGKEPGGVPPEVAPFYDVIGQVAFGDGVPDEQAEAVIGVANKMLAEVRTRAGIIGFWQRAPEVNRLKGELSTLVLLSGVAELQESCDRLVAEVTDLARHRHERIMGRGGA